MNDGIPIQLIQPWHGITGFSPILLPFTDGDVLRDIGQRLCLVEESR